MSVKHIKEYYEDVANQYMEMLSTLKDYEDAVNKNVIEPERLDKFKEIIEPLKANYMTLSWIMYLLNQPNKDSKAKKYKKQTSLTKRLDLNYSKENILKENSKAIEELKESMKG